MDPLINQGLADALSDLITRLLNNVDNRSVGDSNIPFKKPIIVSTGMALSPNRHYHFTVTDSFELPSADIGDFLKITRNTDREPTFIAPTDETIRWVNGTMAQFIYNVSSELVLVKVTETTWELLVSTPVATATSNNTIKVTLPATISEPGKYLLEGAGELMLITPVGQPDGLVYELLNPVGSEPTIRTSTNGFVTTEGEATIVALDTRRVQMFTYDDKYHL